MPTHAKQLADLLTTKELAEYLGKSERSLIRWRQRRIGPHWVKVGNEVRYRADDVNRWLENHVQEAVREAS